MDTLDFQDEIKSKKNQELLKMVYQFDTWSPEMLTSIQSELSLRGILPQDIKEKQEQKIIAEENRLAAGKAGSPLVLLLGWVTVFGLIGLFIGYYYGYSKVRSINSNKHYYRYTESTRKDGKVLFIASIIIISGLILYDLLEL
jgi:hypothetical protein